MFKQNEVYAPLINYLYANEGKSHAQDVFAFLKDYFQLTDKELKVTNPNDSRSKWKRIVRDAVKTLRTQGRLMPRPEGTIDGIWQLSEKGLLEIDVDEDVDEDSATDQVLPFVAYQYWISGLRTVYPAHSKLQNKYMMFLEETGTGSNVKKEKNYVDVEYKNKDGQLVFVEIKPAQQVGSKYAIRNAVGQLLEYRYAANESPILEIVIDEKPTSDDVGFLKSINFRLLYLNHNNDFIRVL